MLLLLRQDIVTQIVLMSAIAGCMLHVGKAFDELALEVRVPDHVQHKVSTSWRVARPKIEALVVILAHIDLVIA